MQQCFLIDDEPIFNLISSKVISRSGWPGDVRVFISAKVALEEIKSHVKQEGILPSIIFLDIRMPEMDGFQFLEELNNLPQEPLKFLRIYLLTSSLDQKDIVRSKQYKLVRGFLSKPLDMNTLKDILYNTETYFLPG